MKTLFGLFVLFCNLYNVLSQNAYSGDCQEFGTTQLQGFRQCRYMGFWIIHKIYDYSDVKGKDCLTSNYTTTVPFKNAKILEESKDLVTKERYQINSEMVFDTPDVGHYKYEIPDEDIYNWPIDIVATDYDNYSIEWSCSPDGPNTGCFIWIMSRNRTVGDAFWDKVDPILKAHNISQDNMRTVVQDEASCLDVTSK